MVPKAPLTSHSRMTGSRWMITPPSLCGSLRSFLCSSSVYSSHLLLISSVPVKFIAFLSFIGPVFHVPIMFQGLHSPFVSLIFLTRSLVFPILLFSSISLHWSLRMTFLSLLALLCKSAFSWVYFSFSPLSFASLLFSAACKTSSDNHFAFLHSFLLGMVWSQPSV